jgi:hypothetical protein
MARALSELYKRHAAYLLYWYKDGLLFTGIDRSCETSIRFVRIQSVGGISGEIIIHAEVLVRKRTLRAKKQSG